MTSKERLEIANAFIGCGNPEGKIWFMGVEEADNEWTEKNLNEYKEKNFKPVLNLENSKRNTTYGGYKKILEEVFPGYNIKDNVFLTNLWPFPKKNLKATYNLEMKKLFGFDMSREDFEIIEEIKHERFKCLKEFFHEYNWKDRFVFFCVGNQYTELFLEFMKSLTDDVNFEFDEVTYKPVGIHEKYNKIYWTYHASSCHIKDDHRKFIKNTVEKIKVNFE